MRKARVLEKKLDQSWKCPPIKQFVLTRGTSALHCINVMQQSDIHIYLEDSPNLPLNTNFGDSETYAQKAIKLFINHGALGKGKEKGKRKNRYSASYHGDKNLDNPRNSEK